MFRALLSRSFKRQGGVRGAVFPSSRPSQGWLAPSGIRKPFDESLRKLDQPYPQPYYSYDDNTHKWMRFEAGPGKKVPAGVEPALDLRRLALYSWNVDARPRFPQARMDAALHHIEELASKLPPTVAVVIFLQECVELSLDGIRDRGWIRERFHVTDLDSGAWGQLEFGTTALVDRRLRIASCFRVYYSKSRLMRDACFVDVELGAGGAAPLTVRLCNTHLDALSVLPPYRPRQVWLIAQHLRSPAVGAGVVAGDFNATEAYDRTLHSENRLRDAYLELGGREDAPDSHTWGPQAQTALKTRHPAVRMDKVLFTGPLTPRSFERFGIDIQLWNPMQQSYILDQGYEKPWISDHYGVVANFDVDS
ncbi:Endonuclease/exonuclease/phosphatase [Durotheca rogersii]|uniref:Endonuclease/exonuclease/phosphatase n=1 Tax=Durotheca rogersii TaxID=419775 RepID=UPI0022204067|nr:Endonuclease/exonuclease/phosphatase [Durotheca rogersii]KAI5863148.1 Endonuclease/exonuclease/phosphatase [Durotheca rogersii]